MRGSERREERAVPDHGTSSHVEKGDETAHTDSDGQGSLYRFFTDSAVLALIAPAVLALAGYVEVQAFHSRLGLIDASALPPPVHVMLPGAALLVLPLVSFVAIYFLLWAILSWEKRELLPPFHLREFPVFALVAAGTWMAAVISLIEIGDDSLMLVEFVELTIVDLIVLLAGTALIVGIVAFSIQKTRVSELLAGRTVTGTALLVLLAATGVTAHADFVGTDRGSDVAWSCDPFMGAQVEAPAASLPPNATYHVVAHQGGSYYLRNSSLPGDEFEILVVPDELVERVTYHRLPGRPSC